MIDLIVLLLLGVYAVAGYRRGFVLGAASLTGLALGALLGIALAPTLVSSLGSARARTIAIVLVVFGAAIIGQSVAALLARRIRRTVHRNGAGGLDRALGALASLLVTAVVFWFVAGALRQSGMPVVSKAVADSRVLTTIDQLMPSRVSDLAAQLRRSVADTSVPRVFEGLSPERIAPVDPPNSTVLSAAELRRVRNSTVKVLGTSPRCGVGSEGSGVVIAPHRVLTNAHVVAGTASLEVQRADGGPGVSATVVLYDPLTDVAVLAVPDLSAPALAAAKKPLARSDSALLAGYPENGPYASAPARVRSVLRAKGEDIHGRAGVVRQVYSLYASVRQGNSGGPLVDADGQLAGLIFATSLDDPTTGYALTLDEVADEIRSGISARQQVSTGRCIST